MCVVFEMSQSYCLDEAAYRGYILKCFYAKFSNISSIRNIDSSGSNCGSDDTHSGWIHIPSTLVLSESVCLHFTNPTVFKKTEQFGIESNGIVQVRFKN